ncbi:hypothetical protein GWK08_11925 [Leptobacterium flavescens]|uniref:Uncharacterized protein n=1 Tax=Leptobacterium flavescens TaxID=472055 RepID=A0A6P0UTH6_9FLAO|nr:hypothetical protein [Leptobacterium flavescens]NER14153.1 hypothetical protein [Leptobacterium flavescens]
MNKKTPIQEKIDKTIYMASEISEPKVSPFFKDKVINKLYAEREEPQPVPIWFAPKYQLVVLIALLILNSYVLYQYSESNREQNIDSFARNYDLSSGDSEFTFE